jgi:hypothetical protein
MKSADAWLKFYFLKHCKGGDTRDHTLKVTASEGVTWDIEANIIRKTPFSKSRRKCVLWVTVQYF